MELSVLIIVHATSVEQACLVVPQTLDLAGENDVIARPHGLETRTFHFKAVVPLGCDAHCSLIGRACRVCSIWLDSPFTLSNQILHT